MYQVDYVRMYFIKLIVPGCRRSYLSKFISAQDSHSKPTQRWRPPCHMTWRGSCPPTRLLWQPHPRHEPVFLFPSWGRVLPVLAHLPCCGCCSATPPLRWQSELAALLVVVGLPAAAPASGGTVLGHRCRRGCWRWA